MPKARVRRRIPTPRHHRVLPSPRRPHHHARHHCRTRRRLTTLRQVLPRRRAASSHGQRRRRPRSASRPRPAHPRRASLRVRAEAIGCPNSRPPPHRRAARPMRRSRPADWAAAQRARPLPRPPRQPGRLRRASPFQRPLRGRRCLPSSAQSAGAIRPTARPLSQSVDSATTVDRTCSNPRTENRIPQLSGTSPLIRPTKRLRKRDDPRQGGRRRRSSCISPGGSG